MGGCHCWDRALCTQTHAHTHARMLPNTVWECWSSQTTPQPLWWHFEVYIDSQKRNTWPASLCPSLSIQFKFLSVSLYFSVSLHLPLCLQLIKQNWKCCFNGLHVVPIKNLAHEQAPLKGQSRIQTKTKKTPHHFFWANNWAMGREKWNSSQIYRRWNDCKDRPVW